MYRLPVVRVVILFLFIIWPLCQSDSLDSILTGQAQAVQNICQQALQTYTTTSTTVCSYIWGCNPEAPSSSCNPKYGNDTACNCNGRQVNSNGFRIMFAPGQDPGTINGSICSLNDLLPKFIENYGAFTEVVWQYIGLPNGAMITFPAQQWMETTNGTCLLNSSCPAFDPRIRPWYGSAITGTQNIVILVDVSVSMGRYGKLQAVIDGISDIFDTLGSEDYINIIAFNDNAISCPDLAPGLNPVSSNVTTAILNWLNSIIPSNGTNFINPFQMAFNILNPDIIQNTACNNVIIFITDGFQDQGLPDAFDFIQNTPFIIKPIVFTYSIDINADDNFNKEVACYFGGSFYKTSTDDTDISEKLVAYSTFLHNSYDSTNVHWTNPYTDFTLGVDVITATVACYRSDIGLIGVAGIDVLASGFYAISGVEGLLERLVVVNANFCEDIQLNSTEREMLREDYSKCIISGSSASTPLTMWLYIFVIFVLFSLL